MCIASVFRATWKRFNNTTPGRPYAVFFFGGGGREQTEHARPRVYPHGVTERIRPACVFAIYTIPSRRETRKSFDPRRSTIACTLSTSPKPSESLRDRNDFTSWRRRRVACVTKVVDRRPQRFRNSCLSFVIPMLPRSDLLKYFKIKTYIVVYKKVKIKNVWMFA